MVRFILLLIALAILDGAPPIVAQSAPARYMISAANPYAAQAGLKAGVHTHTLRHTFASHMLEGDADLRVIQELLGHSSPTTTQIYTHVTQQEARNAYLTFHPRAGGATHPAPVGEQEDKQEDKQGDNDPHPGA